MPPEEGEDERADGERRQHGKRGLPPDDCTIDHRLTIDVGDALAKSLQRIARDV
jgi:hypothetical protein